MISEKRRALITGGSAGIGLAIARELSAAGWEATIAGRRPSQLAAARCDASRDGLVLDTIVADVTSEDGVRAMFEAATRPGPVHLCVANVGRNIPGRLVKRDADPDEPDGVRRYPLTDWTASVQVNLTSAFLTGREAAAQMVAHGVEGAIITISSAVRRGVYGQTGYCATKAGLDALTRTWALELAEYGIRVAGVAPGVVVTDGVREKMAGQPSYRAYLGRLKESVPLARWAEPGEIASAVRFVAEHEYITGTVLEIDGGGITDRMPG